MITMEFFDGAVEISDAEVDDQVIGEGLMLVRKLWDAGIAHRDIKPANLMVRDSRVLLIDVFFVQVLPTPWRQAVDLANMMLVLALHTDAPRVYREALKHFTPDEIAEAFAATRGVASPTQLRQFLKRDERDLISEFRELAPARRADRHPALEPATCRDRRRDDPGVRHLHPGRVRAVPSRRGPRCRGARVRHRAHHDPDGTSGTVSDPASLRRLAPHRMGNRHRDRHTAAKPPSIWESTRSGPPRSSSPSRPNVQPPGRPRRHQPPPRSTSTPSREGASHTASSLPKAPNRTSSRTSKRPWLPSHDRCWWHTSSARSVSPYAEPAPHAIHDGIAPGG